MLGGAELHLPAGALLQLPLLLPPLPPPPLLLLLLPLCSAWVLTCSSFNLSGMACVMSPRLRVMPRRVPVMWLQLLSGLLYSRAPFAPLLALLLLLLLLLRSLLKAGPLLVLALLLQAEDKVVVSQLLMLRL